MPALVSWVWRDRWPRIRMLDKRKEKENKKETGLLIFLRWVIPQQHSKRGDLAPHWLDLLQRGNGALDYEALWHGHCVTRKGQSRGPGQCRKVGWGATPCHQRLGWCTVGRCLGVTTQAVGNSWVPWHVNLQNLIQLPWQASRPPTITKLLQPQWSSLCLSHRSSWIERKALLPLFLVAASPKETGQQRTALDPKGPTSSNIHATSMWRKNIRFPDKDDTEIREGIADCSFGKWAEIKAKHCMRLGASTAAQIKDCMRTPVVMPWCRGGWHNSVLQQSWSYENKQRKEKNVLP